MVLVLVLLAAGCQVKDTLGSLRDKVRRSGKDFKVQQQEQPAAAPEPAPLPEPQPEPAPQPAPVKKGWW